LRRHEWSSRDRTWTKKQLAKERAEYFDTRVTGRPEIWQTVHAALHVLWEPASPDAQDDGSNGLATAQMILRAAEISLPTGNLKDGVYDHFGNYYPIPEWIVCDPRNIVEEPSEGAKGDGPAPDDDEDTTAEDDDVTDEDEDEDEIEGRKREKGKEVIDVRMQVALRARLSENGQDIKVSFVETETVKAVAKKIAQAAKVSLLLSLPQPKDSANTSWSSPRPNEFASPTWERCSRRTPPSPTRAGRPVMLLTPWSSIDNPLLLTISLKPT
jgi:hypothetical protein